MSQTFIIGSDIPEGLHLALTPDEEPGIFDAQDVCWITFLDGGNEDPVRWQTCIVTATCTALGVTAAFDEEGNEVTVAQFLEIYNGTKGQA